MTEPNNKFLNQAMKRTSDKGWKYVEVDQMTKGNGLVE